MQDGISLAKILQREQALFEARKAATAEETARGSRLCTTFVETCLTNYEQMGMLSYLSLLNAGARQPALEGPHQWSPALLELLRKHAALSTTEKHDDRHLLLHPFSLYALPAKDFATGRVIGSAEPVTIDQVYLAWKGGARPVAMYGPNVVIEGLADFASVHKNSNPSIQQGLERIFDDLVDCDQDQILQLRFMYPGGEEFQIARWPQGW
jgi:hypothetical protein